MRTMSCEEIESIKASLSVTNLISLVIFESVNDSLKTALVMGNERSSFVWCKVRYDKEGNAYFNRLGERYYLQYFM